MFPFSLLILGWEEDRPVCVCAHSPWVARLYPPVRLSKKVWKTQTSWILRYQKKNLCFTLKIKLKCSCKFISFFFFFAKQWILMGCFGPNRWGEQCLWALGCVSCVREIGQSFQGADWMECSRSSPDGWRQSWVKPSLLFWLFVSRCGLDIMFPEQPGRLEWGHHSCCGPDTFVPQLEGRWEFFVHHINT